MRLSQSPKIFLYLLILSLPLNLGYHFVTKEAYVGGLLVDYLIPTIYLQDILALLLVLSWLFTNPGVFLATFRARKYVIVYLYLFVLFLSVLLASHSLAALYFVSRVMLYVLAGAYLSTLRFSVSFYRFLIISGFIWLTFLAVLAVAQFYKDGSVFNNYLILGEQPYSLSTPLINKEYVFGQVKVPSYGIFRHPNIFGGILALVLLWAYILRVQSDHKLIKGNLYKYTFLLGNAALILTFSYFSWAAYLLGLLLYKSRERLTFRYLVAVVFTILLLGFFVFNFVKDFSVKDSPSYYKREELFYAGINMSRENNWLFGVGANNQTIHIEQYLKPLKYIRFVQPTHNVFVLQLAEIGLIGSVLYLALIFQCLYLAYTRGNFYITIALIQIMLLSSFDHYFFTIHQPLLTFWIIVGFSLNSSRVS